jgi:cytosine/creatinine deaminase
MDLIVRNAAIDGGRIVALEAALTTEGQQVDVGGRFVSSGLVETHIHLDKTRIIDRCTVSEGTL